MASLNYNITWIDRTFHSRAVTEALLAPERDSGNISHNDYELATRFLPGLHRHYSVHSHLTTLPIHSHSRIRSLEALSQHPLYSHFASQAGRMLRLLPPYSSLPLRVPSLAARWP